MLSQPEFAAGVVFRIKGVTHGGGDPHEFFRLDPVVRRVDRDRMTAFIPQAYAAQKGTPDHRRKIGGIQIGGDAFPFRQSADLAPVVVCGAHAGHYFAECGDVDGGGSDQMSDRACEDLYAFFRRLTATSEDENS